VTYASHMTQELRDLLQNLLRVDPATRYGYLKNGADDIKSHTWFDGMDWLEIYHKKVPYFVVLFSVCHCYTLTDCSLSDYIPKVVSARPCK